MLKSTQTLLILLIISSLQSVFSQDIKFGEISKDALQEQFYHKDSSANAAYLFKYRNTYIDGMNLVTEVHHIIKIYNKEGFDFATKKIALYKANSSDEKVSGLKAVTYNLVNGNIEIEKLSKDAIFKTEYHKRLNHYTFTMPKVKEGSIIEYKYSIYSPFLTNIDEYKFQHSIPVKKLYSKLYTPAFFKFNIKVKGYLPVIPKRSHKRDVRIAADVNITEYIMSDVPALEEEPFVDNIDNYRSGVEYELVAVHYTTHTKYYSQTWNDVAKSVNKFNTYRNELKKSSYYKNDLDEVLLNISSFDERSNKIFDFVKSKVKWNEVDGISSYNGLPKAYKTGTGNVADINLLMVSMMRYAGLKANPILLSTRDNGIPLYPTIDGLNYVICGVELNNDVILLDATSKYSSQNILPVRVMNWYGRLIKEDDTMDNIILTPITPSRASTIMNVKISSEGNIEGRIRNIYKKHNGLAFRKKYSEISNNDYLLEIENKNGNIEIEDYKVDNLEKISGSVIENYSFVKEDHVEIIDNKMYFSPLLFLKENKNPFVLEERLFPIDYAFPWNKKLQIIIKIPEDYTIESIPEPIKFKLPNDIGEFSYMIKKTSNNNIQLMCSTTMKFSKISSDQYLFLKQFYNQIIIKETEKIVLTKNII